MSSNKKLMECVNKLFEEQKSNKNKKGEKS
jgi:hypothetical protein